MRRESGVGAGQHLITWCERPRHVWLRTALGVPYEYAATYFEKGHKYEYEHPIHSEKTAGG
eukprot:scaffold533767_cov14-Prasinocladus_malaysianus.AAC.1